MVLPTSIRLNHPYSAPHPALYLAIGWWRVAGLGRELWSDLGIHNGTNIITCECYINHPLQCTLALCPFSLASPGILHEPNYSLIYLSTILLSSTVHHHPAPHTRYTSPSLHVHPYLTITSFTCYQTSHSHFLSRLWKDHAVQWWILVVLVRVICVVVLSNSWTLRLQHTKLQRLLTSDSRRNLSNWDTITQTGRGCSS